MATVVAVRKLLELIHKLGVHLSDEAVGKIADILKNEFIRIEKGADEE